MTWVEVMLLMCGAGVMVGIVKRRTTAGKGLLAVCGLTAAGLLAMYGPEFVADLL